MHHLIDTKLEVKIYGREHKCYVLVRDRAGEYEVEITPTKDGRLDYVELFDRVPVTSGTEGVPERTLFNINNVSEGPASL
jgi:hypothetical protein